MILAKAAITKLNTTWKSKQVSFLVKLRLLRSVVISVLLCGCEAWKFNERKKASLRNVVLLKGAKHQMDG